MARLALVLAAGVALSAAAGAAPAAAQTAPAEAPRALAYRLPAEALPAEALLDEAQPATGVRPDTLIVPQDEWLGRDKVLHFGASLALTLSGQYVLTDKGGVSNGRAAPVSAAVALGIGVAKEVVDSRRAVNPLFSLRDLAADALGVAVGVLVTRL